ncbi:MAG: ribbon-helix-helix protein, CopG family [Acidobacteria bacterium]|nr:ribbon-helix-helix protein, CopG family [Acidobacteriota bacterium]
MVKSTVYLHEDVALRLRQMAQVSGRPQAELIREALMLYTEQAKRPLPRGIGAYRSGRHDLSRRTEEILAKAAKARQWD